MECRNFVAKVLFMLVDPLSDLIHLADAKAVISAGVKASGYWSMDVDVGTDLKFVAVTQGECSVSSGNRISVRLEKGDCLLIRGPVSFTIGTKLEGEAMRAADVFERLQDGFAVIDTGQTPDFTCLGGRMEAGEDLSLLTSSLQPLTFLASGTKPANRVRWLLEQLEGEMAGAAPGSRVVCEQIMQMVFVEMIRLGIQSGSIQPGLLSALSEPRIAPALSAIHSEPRHHWNLGELARLCNLSRSQFSARFTDAAGVSPIEYLFRWRMHLARKALAKPDSSVAKVAEEAGYQSEAAFGAAFKRMFGAPPRRHISSTTVKHCAAALPTGVF